MKISLELILCLKGDNRKMFPEKKINKKSFILNQYLKGKATYPAALNHQAHQVHQILHQVHLREVEVET